MDRDHDKQLNKGDNTDDDAKPAYVVKKELTDLPDLPDETEIDDSFIGVDSIVNDETIDENEKKEKLRGVKDDKQVEYDPVVHAYPPTKTTTGAWRKKRGAKKSTPADNVSNAEYRKSAEQMALAYAGLNYAIFGEGAEPKENTDLLGPTVDGFEAFAREQQVEDFPAWVQLVIGCGNYTIGVATKPKPRQRVKRWWKSLVGWFGFGGVQSDDVTKVEGE